ncbi:MAG TPA: hypothetical protein VMT20_15000 [Terriglobia bacterium]|nr:hypothetical protein [Terriglobia bacterium]
MRVALRISSSNEHSDGGCEFALVEVTPGLAALALRRIAALRAQKSVDPDIDETYCWTSCVERHFSPGITPKDAGAQVEAVCLVAAESLCEGQNEETGVVKVPDSFQVPSCQIAAVECQEMIVRLDSIAFSAAPKHASFYIHTAEIPLATLEPALVPPARA